MQNTPLYRFGIIAVVTGFIGCATSTTGGIAVPVTATADADAVVHVQGLACPGCVSNVEDSLVRLTGIERILTDLNTGIVRVWFKQGETTPTTAQLLEAVRQSGFTPTEVVMNEEETS